MHLGNEPIRILAWLAGVITAIGTFLVQWAQGGDWRIALGTSLLGLGVIVGGGELGRSQAYGPETANEIIDADAVIRQAEGRG